MIIKASVALRNDHTSISNMAKETKEGDLALMSIEAYEKREQILMFRAKFLQAEQERMEGARTLRVSEAR